MTWSIDEAAQRMGMPSHEVLAVAEVGDYHVVTTHDGQHTVVTDAGHTEPYAGEPAALADPQPLRLADPDADEEPPGGAGIRLDLGAVPDGTAAEVLEWVNEQPETAPDRARRALEVENGKDKPRSGLVAQLEKLAEPA